MEYVGEPFKVKAIGILHKTRVFPEFEKEVPEVTLPEIQPFIFPDDLYIFEFSGCKVLHPS
jgi:hypothetical protein